MPLYTLTDKQLNYFKFAAIVLDEFPEALRKTFVSLWDNPYAGPPTNLPWDDSVAVRNQLNTNEGGHGKCDIPTHLSYKDWDCTALFKATIYAKSFTSGRPPKTLSSLYAGSLPGGTFHMTVESSTGNYNETCTLAIDQLRRLRNTACHQASTKGIDKKTFDSYANLAKDAFTALGLSTATIDNIKGLKQEDFPTKKVHRLMERLLVETSALLKLQEGMEDIKGDLKNLQETVEGLGHQLKNFLREQRPSSKLPKSHLFPMVPHFIGRAKECDEIMYHLTTQLTRLVSVWGSPGFGKTSVATAVGHDLDSQVGHVLFISLRQVKSVSEMAQRILSLSQQSDQPPFQNETEKSKVLQWLSSVSIPLYLFLDNSDDLLENKDEYLQFIRDILASSTTVKLLCTTRESLEYAKHSFPTASVRIQPLDKASSRTLVQNLAPNVSDNDADAITKICGDVPLAIKLVCSIVTENGKLSPHWNEFTNELSSSTMEALDMPDNPEDLRLKSLFEHCFRKLSFDQQSAFVCLSVFNGFFSLDAAMAALDAKKSLATKKVLNEIVRQSLLEYDADSMLYTIHPLLQSFGELIGETEMKTIFHDAKIRFYGYYLEVLEKLNKEFLAEKSSTACQVFQMEQQNIIQSLLNGIRTEEHYTTVVSALSESEMLLASIFWNDTSQFEDIYENAIKSAQAGHEASDCTQLLVSKAFAFLTRGREGKKSADLLQEAEKQYDAHSISAETKGKLQCYRGIDLVIRGKTEDGMKCVQAAYSILSESAVNSVIKVLTKSILELCNKSLSDENIISEKDMLDEGHVSTFCFLNSEMSKNAIEEDQPFMLQMVYLFNAVCEKLNTLKEMENMAKFVLNIQRQVEDSLGDEVRLSSLYHAVSSLLLHLNQYKQALHCYEKILQSQNRASPNEDTVYKAETYQCLGVVQHKLGDHEGALQSKTKAAKMRQALLGEHEQTAHSYIELGCTQYRLADYKGSLKSHKKALVMRQKLLGEHEDTARSYNELGWTQYQLADYQGSLKSNKAALAMRQKIFGEHELTANSYHSIGATLFRMADYKGALEAHKTALAMRQKILGGHENTANSYHNIGETLYQLADYQGSLEADKKALAMQLKLLGEHEDTATSYHKIGRTLYRMTDFEGALEASKKAQAMRQKLLGEHELTASSCHNTGQTLYRMTDYEGALEASKKALAMRQKLLGEHELTASSYHNTGQTLYRMADYEGALEAYKKALVMRQKLLGEHEDTATSYKELGCTQYEMIDYQSSLESHKEALAMRQKLLGEHKDTASSYCELGVTLYRMADYEGALEAYKKALAMRQKILGEHEDTASTYHNIGITLYRMADYEGALEAYKKALAMRQKLLGEHEDTATSYHYIGGTLFLMTDYEGALEANKKALSMRQQLLGEHEDTATSYHNIGVTLYRMADYESALEAYKKALAMRQKILGEHEDTASTYHNIGVTLYRMADYEGALGAYKKALVMREKLLGEHEDTALSYIELGSTQLYLADYQGALESYTKAVAMRLKLLGEHEDTAKSYENLGVAQFLLADWRGALNSHTKATVIRQKVLK